MRNKILLSLMLLLVPCFFTAANEAHYLPLKSDPLIELELEKLSTVAGMPVLAKPYHIATVKSYLKKISNSHPKLFNRITAYLSRYKQDANITQLKLEASYANTDDKNISNSRGLTSGSEYAGDVTVFWRVSDNMNLSLGAHVYQDSSEVIPVNTFLSYTHDYFQIDVGFKEHWYSPFQESAMLLSTNAKPIANFSLSSPKPLTDWNFRYDISYGKLDKMEGIRFGDEPFSGKPGFLSMHFSAQPFDWWTLGVSRTLVFGGGPRDIDAGDVWQAIIDPVSGDNCGGDSELQDCDDEAGNQQASVSSKFDFYWGMPMSLYVELAGEDTNDFKPYLLGNKAYNIGLFLPYLSEKSSFLMEYQQIENAWYTHHLYQEGYRNDLNSLGHWWGDEKLINDSIGANILTLRYNHELSSKIYFDMKFSTIKNQNNGDEGVYDESVYEIANELTLGLDLLSGSHVWRYQLYLGNDLFGDDFVRASVEFRWF